MSGHRKWAHVRLIRFLLQHRNCWLEQGDKGLHCMDCDKRLDLR